MDSTGLYAPSELFGNKWDKEDPLAQDDYNQNLLAWFSQKIKRGMRETRLKGYFQGGCRTRSDQ